jgi:hypothetical protein
MVDSRRTATRSSGHNPSSPNARQRHLGRFLDRELASWLSSNTTVPELMATRPYQAQSNLVGRTPGSIDLISVERAEVHVLGEHVGSSRCTS